MGIKHLTEIETILKNHGLPMLKLEISHKYKKKTGISINFHTLTEVLNYLISQNKIKKLTTKFGIQYMWCQND